MAGVGLLYAACDEETYLGPYINPAAPADAIPLSLIMFGCCSDANNSASSAKSLWVNKCMCRKDMRQGCKKATYTILQKAYPAA